MKILGFVGSLRAGSYNRALYNEFVSRLPAGAAVEEGLYGHLPLFNQDIESPMPADVIELQKKIQNADGIVIATPEFNRSIPGAFKNMLDWCSRGELEDCWAGKRVYIMGCSSGDRGANMAQYDLRRIMLYFGAHVMGTPELFVGRNKEKFDAEMRLVDEPTKKQLDKIVAAFATYCK